ncbi:MAG: hypothetical protein AAGC44_09825 [Planctomycetota bacterium]
MKNTTPLVLSAASALLLASASILHAANPTDSAQATKRTAVAQEKQAQTPVVTRVGFDALAEQITLYTELRIEGTIGQNCTPDSVRKSLVAAATDPHIDHVVLMVDVDPTPIQGAMLDKEVVDAYPGELNVHSIVKTGLNFAVFPIFSSDNIYMTEGAVIGGMSMHYFLPPGSTEVTAKLVGITASQLATAAQSHGHNPDIARAMVDSKKELFYWREEGEVRVSNDRPLDPQSVQSLERIESALFGDTLTLDQQTAIRIRLAQPIDDYDAWSIGEKLEIEQWELGNRYAHCAHPIGAILAELTPQIDEVEQIDREFDEPNRNDPDYRELREAKQAISQAITGMKQIEQALITILDNHPERHAYFPGRNGQTILADPAQWKADVDRCSTELSRIRSGIAQIRAAMIKFYADPDRIKFLQDDLDQIQIHLDGIKQHGNAKYWEEVYVPEPPPDIYG